MKKYFAVVACAAIAGCVSAPQINSTTPVKLNQAEIDAVHSVIVAKLKDPGSVQWGEVKAGANSNGKIFVCGLVNAKNSFGGYNGMTPYLGDMVSGRFLFGGMGGTPETSTAAYQVCDKLGLSLS